jgi:hypothetical protein
LALSWSVPLILIELRGILSSFHTRRQALNVHSLHIKTQRDWQIILDPNRRAYILRRHFKVEQKGNVFDSDYETISHAFEKSRKKSWQCQTNARAGLEGIIAGITQYVRFFQIGF